MKKLILYMPAILLFAVLTGLLFFMCWPQNLTHADIRGGTLDLRGEDMALRLFALHGQWDFVFGELLAPEDFAGRQPETMKVPASWNEAGYPTDGCATYRLTMYTDSELPFAIYLPETFSAYALWLNGSLVRTSGTVSADPSAGEPYFENALLPVRADGGVVEIVLQISNYHYYESGICGTIMFGGNEAVQAWFVQTRAFYCVALGCILMAAFYHLTLYSYRRREKAYLLFALLCFLCFLRFLVETNGLNEFFQWLPMDMLGIRIYLFMFFSHSVAIVAFSLYIFNQAFLYRFRAVITAYFLLMVLLGTAMPFHTPVYVMVTGTLALLAALVNIIIVARSPVLKENSATRLYFAAMILYLFIGASSKLWLDNTLFMMGMLSNMFLVMSQSLVLARRYADAFHFAEETNQNLERIVDERTRSLQAVNSAMQSTNTAMKELVSNISHDLKTPLAVLSVNLEALSEMALTQSDAVYQRHVRTAYQKNLDLQRLIQNLFEVSRIETGAQLYMPQWMPLLSLLAQLKERYDTFLEDLGILFEVTVESDAEISADPQKIGSVFDNIIYNAARYTPSGGSISVIAQDNGSAVTVTITDTGCGIEAKHMPHIFERFYKGTQARSTTGGDSGLGLYIVKSVMEGCGGRVDAQSERHKGTSIILTFLARPNAGA